MCVTERESYTEIYNKTDSEIEKETKKFFYTVGAKKIRIYEEEKPKREVVRCKEKREFCRQN